MENKLEQLTQKLYQEGLSKGRDEGEKILTDAQLKAKKIVIEAETEAKEIVKKAHAQAEELQKNTMTEISLAGKQAVGKIKEQIANAIVAKSVSGGVKQANADSLFIKDMLLSVAKNWNGASSDKITLQALLPADKQKELDSAFENSAKELLAAGIEVGYSSDVRSGFKVGTSGGGYYISFSDDDYEALLGQYLREKVSKLLYDKQ